MKLYYSPGACSLASRISIYEAGLSAEFVRVDLASKITERGEDYMAVNPAGSVPLLVLDDGQPVSENVAILTLLAGMAPQLAPSGPFSQIRLIQILSFLSTELHIAFKPFWHSASESDKAAASAAVVRRLTLIENDLRELYLFGPRFTTADAYLFVMLRWAREFAVPISAEMKAYFERVAERPAVRAALAEEGLPVPLPDAMPEMVAT
ncbi:MAG: glutathione S-transferase N-terminal domain-containing protein [Sphingomonadaceae bacterium]|nr:glutathione S-transferase N-terminal domain-containing protein [Sphingomonadaceae bacterium]